MKEKPVLSVIERLSDQLLTRFVPKAEASAGSCTCNCAYNYYYSCKNCVKCYICTDCTAGGTCLRCSDWNACC
ncbi:hypothetical protein ACIBF6_32965 [Streptosporangium amethystogenes]|uniref:hypothetical protein n=1 Tax=Streptosporangium amethystogenes TaxID=2002 RepID=UPI0037B4FE48